MRNIDDNFRIRYEKAQAKDLRQRAIALKDLGFDSQAKLLLKAARHSEAKALILLYVAKQEDSCATRVGGIQEEWIPVLA